ncbi:hypothetical protein, partial [Caldibacillus thermoamylovorans]|uniref:hypothetical protein n=1 Tax=Caldibacillus thermoamylovorans TaxID=35841 RepID=UPI001F15FA6B
SMGQNHRSLKQNCPIDRLYGTNQAEIQVKMSHRIGRIMFYGTKPPEFEAKLSHRSAVWDKTSGNSS